MKVLFLTGSLNQGGAEFQILILARLFKERGNEVEVFALTDHSFYKSYVDEHGIRYSHLFNHQSKVRRLWLTAKKFREWKPEVVIAYLKVVGQIAIFARLLSFNRFKLLVGERTSRIMPKYDFYYFNLLRLCDGVTVNSLSKRAYINDRFPFLSRKTYFFPNILDLNLYRPGDFSGQARTLAFIGRISPEKNVVQLILAFKRLIATNSHFVLNIYGDSRNAVYMSEVQAAIESNGLNAHVHLRGRSENVVEIYKKTDLLCLISDYEGFSNVISEALSCGIPVIASNIPENRYLVEEGVNGFLVNQKNVEDIAVGILKYVHLDYESKFRMRQTNRRKAESLFDSERIYSDYMRLFNSNEPPKC